MKKGLFILLFTVSVTLGIKCGLVEAIRTKSSLFAPRPGLTDYFDSEDGHFRVWFTLEGDSAIDPTDTNPADGIPDWAQRAAEYLERAWACLVDTIGAKEPLPDFGAGGSDRVDLYLVELSGVYGMTYMDSLLPDGSATAYMVIENDFEASDFPEYIGREEEALAVTCAHEFFHTIHYSYSANLSWVWWMEATAVWSEERNFPSVNDYLNYLHYFQDHPDVGLNDDSPTYRIYGACLFPIYLSENYGDTAIIDIWERVPVFTEYGAIYRWADSVGVALDDLYGDFARWNLFVGDYHRDFGYPDADSMPEPAFIMPSEFPEILDGGGAAVYIDLADSYTGGAWATVEGGDSVSAVLYGIVPHGRTDTPDTSVDIFNINDTIPGVWRYDKLIAVVANLSSYYGWDADLGDFLYGPAPSATVELLGDVLDEPP